MYSSTLSLTSALDGPQGRSGRVQKISPPTGIRSPDRSARSETLYRLRYPGPKEQSKSSRVLVSALLSSHRQTVFFIDGNPAKTYPCT